MKKKLLITLIAVCTMLFTFGMINVSAVSSGTCGDNLTWTYDCGTLTISGQGKMTNWPYDSAVPWYPSRERITNVVIENGVTSIGIYAFNNLKNLTSITIPDSLTNIGDYAFYYCNGLESITIPDNVTSIGDYTFYYFSSLNSIALPENLISIGDKTFSGCSSLESITIPDSVTSIGGNAFSYCSSLESITIPDSVTSIGGNAFRGCSSLRNVIVDVDNANFCSDDGVLFNKIKTMLIHYPAGKTKTEYIIADSVTNIGDNAFFKCSSLTSITIPDGVTSIGDYAFSNCSSLESITIPDGVTIIGQDMFDRCSSLTSITIPNSITSIGQSAFYNCNNLKDIYFDGTEEEWGKISISGYNSPLANATIHYKLEEYRINEITIKDMSGNSLQAIQIGTFLATVSFTNVSSNADTVIILAQYTDTGAFKGLMYIQTEDVPTGSTIKLSIPVDNSKGDVAKLKAFCWESFTSLTPIGNSASFPAE